MQYRILTVPEGTERGKTVYQGSSLQKLNHVIDYLHQRAAITPIYFTSGAPRYIGTDVNPEYMAILHAIWLVFKLAAAEEISHLTGRGAGEQ